MKFEIGGEVKFALRAARAVRIRHPAFTANA